MIEFEEGTREWLEAAKEEFHHSEWEQSRKGVRYTVYGFGGFFAAEIPALEEVGGAFEYKRDAERWANDKIDKARSAELEKLRRWQTGAGIPG